MLDEQRQASSGAHDVELARALVPVLLERIRAATQRLARVEARLVEQAEDPVAAEALSREAREADALGWLLGWIAGGLGSELLLERHEPRALALALELVRTALEQRGCVFEPPALPAVTKAGGWPLAWGVAGLAWRAGADNVTGVDLRLVRDEEGAGLVAHGATAEAVAARGRALERELASTRFEARADGWRWTFPREWVEAGA